MTEPNPYPPGWEQSPYPSVWVPTPYQQPPRRPRWPIAVGVISAVLVVAIGAGVAAFLLIRGKPSDAGTFTIRGQVVLAGSYEGIGFEECSGQGRGDIRRGLRITVTDLAGAALGSAPLGPGAVDIPRCKFPFVVTNVPAARGTYTVTVGEHGKVGFAEPDLAELITLTLGGDRCKIICG
jgi:hypothetical protein